MLLVTSFQTNFFYVMINTTKIPIIPTIFYENRFIGDFNGNAEYFNFLFSKQCSLIRNNGSLPADVNYIT